MIRAVIAAILLVCALPEARASSVQSGLVCVAKVLKSEETPYAPMGYWLVRVVLEITPPGGPTFETTVQDTMPWQGPPPRKNQTFRVWCDPANPGSLHLL
jgi:hypothetical protein